ncbi:hypothetical protein [Hyphomonas sp.]|uniref:hypothetical protein n=1 Tax=Hyphomonas sp. TaxID=87 RepID=UPI00391991B4
MRNATIAVSIAILAFAGSAQAQGKESDVIAVCAAHRAPLEDIRKQNRDQMRMQVTKGVLVGVLGGGLAGGLATQGQSDNTQKTAVVAGALIGAFAGGIDQYLAAKRQITQDNAELVRLINSDAAGYANRVDSVMSSIRNTGDCRKEQIAAWEQRLIATRTEFATREAARAALLASAADDKARKSIEKDNKKAAKADGKFLDLMDREEAMIKAALADDKDLYGDILKYFDTDIMAMVEAQARVEGTSAASLRGGAEAYAVEVIPPAILASAAPGGSSTSAFGATTSAFGAPAAPPPAPKPDLTLLAAPDPTDGSAPAWQAQVVRPDAVELSNGHQAALVAQRNAGAEAQAAMQTADARLKVALARGDMVQVSAPD